MFHAFRTTSRRRIIRPAIWVVLVGVVALASKRAEAECGDYVILTGQWLGSGQHAAMSEAGHGQRSMNGGHPSMNLGLAVSQRASTVGNPMDFWLGNSDDSSPVDQSPCSQGRCGSSDSDPTPMPGGVTSSKREHRTSGVEVFASTKTLGMGPAYWMAIHHTSVHSRHIPFLLDRPPA